MVKYSKYKYKYIIRGDGLINVKNRRKPVVLFLALILIVSSITQVAAVPKENRTEYKDIVQKLGAMKSSDLQEHFAFNLVQELKIMKLSDLEEYFHLYDKYHEDERFEKYFKASENSIPRTVEFFVSKYNRQPTNEEQRWIRAEVQGAGKYLNYGGLLGREVTSAEKSLIDEGEGYKIFGIGTKEELRYLELRSSKEFKQLVDMYNVLYDSYDAFEWNKTNYLAYPAYTYRATIRKELLQNHGIDIFDMDYEFRKEIYDSVESGSYKSD